MRLFTIKKTLVLVALVPCWIFVLCGCRSAAKPITFAGNVAAKTVEVSGKIAVQGVKTTGKVVEETGKTGIKTAGDLAKTGTKTSVDVAKYQVVYIKDTATGALKEVPWKEGLSLYMATQTANISPYLAAYTIFRNGGEKVLKIKGSELSKKDMELRPGDYVEVRKEK